MYDKMHAKYIIRSQMNEEYVNDSLKIIDIVPIDGILKMTLKQISRKLKIPEERISEVIEKMKMNRNPLMKLSNDKLVFDYCPKDVEYVKHLRNALSNMGMND